MVIMQIRIFTETLWKDNARIHPLRSNNQLITDAQEKADTLNNQFYSIFTDEDALDILECNDNKVSSNLPLITSVTSIEHRLNLLNTQRDSGPDYVPAYIPHHCATEIAPILKIFSQSVNTGEIPSDWLRANVVPIGRYLVTTTLPL